MVRQLYIMRYAVLLLCLLGSQIISPQPAVASLSQQDYDDLYESLQILSTGWVQEHVDRANQILSRTIYTAADWEEFFTEYFGANPFTDDLRSYLGYPVFWWFGDDVHLNLQSGLMRPMEANIEAIVSGHQSDLGGALDTDPDLCQTMFNSHRFLNKMLNIGVITEPDKMQIYDFYTRHIETYPQLWKKSVTIDILTQPYVATVRAQMYMNLGDALPLTSDRKNEISMTIDLTGSFLAIWNNHSVIVVDNNGLDESQLGVINTYLGEVPATLHNLRYIGVNSLLGNEGNRYQRFENSAGVNIFDVSVGSMTQNGFPDDVEPKYADIFSLTLAHEVNHVVDAYYIKNDQALADRKDKLLEAAGDFHLNYLRSIFEDGFFTARPQEFFASIANQWFADSAHTLELGLVRWGNGYREPINQFLFFAEIYAQGGADVPFYTIDEQGTLTRTTVPIQRDSSGYINELIVDGKMYRFDDFNDGDDNGWTPVSGTWGVENGGYSEESNSAGAPAFSLTDYTTRDMTIEVRGSDQEKPGAYQNFFIVFAYDESTGKAYWAGARVGGNKWTIEEIDIYTGSFKKLAYTSETINTNTWYDIKVIVSGDTVTLYADGVEKVSYPFPGGIPVGRIGLGGHNNHAHFDDFRVTNYTLYTFFDDFNDGNDNGWNPMSGAWRVVNGEYMERSLSTDVPAFSLIDYTTQDMTIEVKGIDQEETGAYQNFFIVFAYDEPAGKAYWAGARVGADKWTIEEMDINTGYKTRLAALSEVINTKTWYDIKVIVSGDTVTVYADGVEKVSYTFPAGIPVGRIGLGGHNNHAHFDDFILNAGE